MKVALVTGAARESAADAEVLAQRILASLNDLRPPPKPLRNLEVKVLK